ncbi:TPA: sulfurtransferase complex subunit TusD [Morganella morganii]
MTPLSYCLLVTGPAYGTQRAGSALLFARHVIAAGHRIQCVFFYREGVSNANVLTSPAGDETDMVRQWQQLARDNDIQLAVCVAAALRRGVTDTAQAASLQLAAANLADGFALSGLGTLAEAMVTCDRVIQF